MLCTQAQTRCEKEQRTLFHISEIVRTLSRRPFPECLGVADLLSSPASLRRARALQEVLLHEARWVGVPAALQRLVFVMIGVTDLSPDSIDCGGTL